MSAKQDPRAALPGVRRRGAGWQVYRQVRGVPYAVTLPLETTAAKLVEAWEAFGGDAPAPAEGSILEAAGEYFPTIKAQATAGQKKKHIEDAIVALGPARALTAIAPGDIDRLIQTWQTSAPIVGGKRGRPAPRVLDGETIRKRLTSLQTFFKVMLPEGAANPVQGCSRRPAPKKPAPRGIPMTEVSRILAAMPDVRDVKKGARRELALGKIRATVTATTGLDPAQIKALTPADLFLTGPAPHFRTSRAKGEGSGIFDVELTPAGLAALEAFVAAGAWGKYAEGSVNKSVKKAAAKVGYRLGTFRQKDLRHSFLTELYRLSKDLATVGRFACHCPGSPMTSRYTLSAHQEIDRAVAARFELPTIAPAAAVLPFAGGRKARR